MLEGAADAIHVRALAVSDGDATALIISTETGRGPYGPQFAQLVAEHTGLPLEAILYTATHSHAAPEFSRGPVRFDAGPDDDQPPAERWAVTVRDRMLEAVDEALAGMRPATLGVGRGESYINVNRRGAYLRKTDDGRTEEYNYLGYNPTGVSDKELGVLEFRDTDGMPIAYVVNYAVHGVVMHGNRMGPNGRTAVSADVPGYVSTLLEKANPGAVALWLSGAAGDQNPIVSNQIISRDPVSGEFTETYIGEYELLNYLGRIHYHDIEKALAGIGSTTGSAEVRYDFAETVIPARDGGRFPVALQLVQIGDVALLGFGGELFTQPGLDIKAASPNPDTFVVTHARQRETQEPGYHADDASAAVGGFGANPAYAPGHFSEALADLTRALLER